MTAEQIRLAMENKLEYLMEVKPQLASDDQLYKAAALVLRDLMVENRRTQKAHPLSFYGIPDGQEPEKQPV